MSWMAKLFETYKTGIGLDLPSNEKLMPISHTLQNAHINIVIDGEGNFKRASVLKKTQIVLPATEKSAGRAGKFPPPHPLADKLQYLAEDYPKFGGRKPSFFPEYHKLLAAWCESDFMHSKAKAVYCYIKKGNVVEDLIEKANILHIDSNRQLLTSWPFEPSPEQPVPDIFKVLPKEKGELDQGAALVCWTVEKEGDQLSQTWKDTSLQDSWMQFDTQNEELRGLCYITGEDKALSLNHPAKLRHTGDKAKLISANDISGFTFRGRFTDSKQSVVQNGSQSVGVSFEVTQKAHNALRWLIARQGYRNDDQVYVSWAISGQAVPEPLEDIWSQIDPDNIHPETMNSEVTQKSKVDHSIDLGESFANRLKKYMAGYHAKLKPNEQIIVLGLDSATPGRMGLIYYRELMASDFLKRLENWHIQFAWPQRFSKEVPSEKKGKKITKKTIWPVCSPVPRNIAESAYGDTLKSNKTLKKNLLERIMPCIIDGQPFPRDIMIAAVRRASNRNSCEHWEWERNLGIACALYKGFYVRHPDKTKRRKYDMALDENKNSRDYLYGRLLAIAERIEQIALFVGGENRPTTAARLMQRFADRPYSTWRNIELSLQPYMQRLQNSRAGFLVNRNKELDAIHSSFQPDEFTSEKPLSGEFLLGYHCQRLFLRNVKSTEIEEN